MKLGHFEIVLDEEEPKSATIIVNGIDISRNVLNYHIDHPGGDYPRLTIEYHAWPSLDEGGTEAA